MSPRRQLVVLSVTVALLASACSGLRLSPVTAQPTGNWIPGKFIWHDLVTHDISAVKLFYAGVFGWRFEALPGTDRYTVIRHDGEMIGGIAFSDRKVDGKPISQWVSMMSVPDVDQAVTRVRQVGGRVYAGPRDIDDRGRLAIVGDPQGAVFGLVRAAGGDPPDREARIGDWLWTELWTDDREASGTVYATVAGFELDTHERVAGRPYTVFKRDGEARAGLLVNPFPEEVTPLWLPYVRVANPAAVVAKVEGLGGQVLLAPNPERREGTVAIIADPTGAEVAIQKWPIDGPGADDDD
jgi:predicted enzyme related to lactoylglutathione lyase